MSHSCCMSNSYLFLVSPCVLPASFPCRLAAFLSWAFGHESRDRRGLKGCPRSEEYSSHCSRRAALVQYKRVAFHLKLTAISCYIYYTNSEWVSTLLCLRGMWGKGAGLLCASLILLWNWQPCLVLNSAASWRSPVWLLTLHAGIWNRMGLM